MYQRPVQHHRLQQLHQKVNSNIQKNDSVDNAHSNQDDTQAIKTADHSRRHHESPIQE